MQEKLTAQSSIGAILQAFSFEVHNNEILARYYPNKLPKKIDLLSEVDYINSINYNTTRESVKDFKESISLDYMVDIDKKPDILPVAEFDPVAFLRKLVPEVIRETMKTMGLS